MLNNKRVLFVVITLIFVMIIGGGTIFLQLPSGICNGELTDVPDELLRSLYFDEATSILWMGSGDGTVYAKKDEDYEKCHELDVVINSINSFEDNVFFATDGAGIFQFNPNAIINRWTQFNEGMIETRFYDLYSFNNELFATSWDGITIFNGEQWREFDYAERRPIGQRNYHSIIYVDGKWLMGSIDGGLHVYDVEAEKWTIYKEGEVFTETRPGVWTPEPFDGYMPLKIRDLSMWNNQIIVASDHPVYGLTVITNLEEMSTTYFVDVPSSLLTSAEFNSQILAVTDWENGIHILGNGEWLTLDTEPAFDVVFVNPQLAYIASALGLLELELPGNVPFCGDGICRSPENSATCPVDCTTNSQ